MRFILIDEIIELVPGKSIEAVKTLSSGEELFQDHFPGFPVVPGVLLTEMMAQAAGKCLDSERSDRGKPMLAQITSAKFREWVPPDTPVHVHCTIQSSRPNFATAACRIETNGRTACSADLLFTFVSADRFAPGWRDEVLDRYLATRR